MAQINLLSSNNAAKPNPGQVVLSISVKVLIAILALTIIYYIWLLISGFTTDRTILQLQDKISQTQSQVLNQRDRQELIVRQGQLAALGNLQRNHVYWSQLFPKLAESTLNGVSYLSFSADDQGKGSMSVSVANYAELDKFLQVFDLPEISENFNQIRVSSITRSQKGDSLETRADIQFRYNNQIIKNKKP